MSKLIRISVLIAMYISTSIVFADSVAALNEHHSHDDISTTVENFVASSINTNADSVSIKVKSLDKRLRLHQCELPLEAFWPPGASGNGHTSVGIRCNDDKPWKIYVSTQIKQFEQVWVTNTAISKGTILNQSHVTLELKEIRHTSSEYFNIDQSPIGLMAKRPLRRGDIVRVMALEKPMAIKRGDRVVVIARINGLEIRTTATAMTAAAEGERIRVRNLSSNKELEGTLHENSIVHVNI